MTICWCWININKLFSIYTIENFVTDSKCVGKKKKTKRAVIWWLAVLYIFSIDYSTLFLHMLEIFWEKTLSIFMCVCVKHLYIHIHRWLEDNLLNVIVCWIFNISIFKSFIFFLVCNFLYSVSLGYKMEVLKIKIHS